MRTNSDTRPSLECDRTPPVGASPAPVWPSAGRPPVALLGVGFDPVTRAEAAELIEGLIASRRPHYVVTPNVDFLVQARHDALLRRILLEAHLVLCDGTPLVWCSRLLGNPLPERVAGADLVPLLIRRAADRGHRLYFLGGAPDVAQQAVARLRQAHPGLRIVGHYSPPYGPLGAMDHGAITDRIRQAAPDLLLVSFGCPKAEKWMAQHYAALGVPVCIGVGATIDFLAGRVKRAPRGFQRTGLEWVYRLAQEPRRLGPRYVRDLGCFSRAMVAQLWHLRRRGGPYRTAMGAAWRSVDDRWQHVQAPTQLDLAAVRAGHSLWARVAEEARDCLLDLNQVRAVDSTGIGLLIWLRKRLLALGQRLVLLAPSAATTNALTLMRLQDLFLTARDARAAQKVLSGAATASDETPSPAPAAVAQPEAA